MIARLLFLCLATISAALGAVGGGGGPGVGPAPGATGVSTSGLSTTLNPNADNIFQTGYGMMGLATSGVSTNFYIAQASNYNATDFAINQTTAGATNVNAKAGQSLLLKIAGTVKGTLTSTSMAFASGVPVTINDATASNSTGTGCLILAGGMGVMGSINIAGNIALTTNRFLLQGASTTYLGSGNPSIYRSGGTITTNAGDLVIQSDAVGARDIYFVAGTSPATMATISGTNGTLTLPIAGGGISIKSGSNARCGTATLTAGSSGAIANTSVTANTRVMCTVQAPGGTQGFLSTSKVNATSFTITSTSGTETSVVAWELVENP